ncbi:putative serine/threonine protein kinase [Karstenula rhodostoma CBS 690.94]|uniref:Serine/threonine protein kinase n=1 Tax=Karstenula rhodostoma CBS 690.94 TaxID=1392251 RepID=A0A9P4PEA4_9PLEO|nr:putative serine/threonine protein kinase [Karstenula rhodostoma CBS 690.94]
MHSLVGASSMASLFRIGQILKGRLGKYTVTTEIQDTVWFAKNQLHENVVIKSVRDHPRVENERDVLKRFQHRTPHLRPLIDEIEEPSQPTTVVLKYLDSDLWQTAQSERKQLNRKELKHVSRAILEALRVLHESGYVHTDVKPSNVFVDLREGDVRFGEVQLGDLGGCCSVDSWYATTGAFAGTTVYSSPEAIMNMRWNTASDIWSFGVLLIGLIYGGNLQIFHPTEPDPNHEEYRVEVLKEQLRFFFPFPEKFKEITSPDTVRSILYLMQQVPAYTPFSRTTDTEISRVDRDFVCKIMKLDWRDRPTVKELLEDEWWNVDEEPVLLLHPKSFPVDQPQHTEVQQVV